MTGKQLMKLAELNYCNGLDSIVECFSPDEIVTFLNITTEEQLKSYAKLMIEQQNNQSYGDSEPKQFNWVSE